MQVQASGSYGKQPHGNFVKRRMQEVDDQNGIVAIMSNSITNYSTMLQEIKQGNYGSVTTFVERTQRKTLDLHLQVIFRNYCDQ